MSHWKFHESITNCHLNIAKFEICVKSYNEKTSHKMYIPRTRCDIYCRKRACICRWREISYFGNQSFSLENCLMHGWVGHKLWNICCSSFSRFENFSWEKYFDLSYHPSDISQSLFLLNIQGLQFDLVMFN